MSNQEGNTGLNSVSSSLAELFRRDLRRLENQISAFSDENALWRTIPGITNSAGNLVLHLEGNLREYIGRQLGRVSYSRQRPLEFSNKGIAKAELVARIQALQESIPAVLTSLTQEQLAAEYPELVLEKPLSTHAFLIHLYGHLNWHLGQVDYLRRILTEDGAIAAVTL